MIKKIIPLVLGAVLLSGCTSTSETEDSLVANNDDLICERTTELGSHIKKRVCMTQAMYEKKKRETEQLKRDIQDRRTPTVNN